MDFSRTSPKIQGLFQDCVNPTFFLHQQYLSSKKVMRIYTTVTKGEMLWSFIKLSQLILSEMYEDQSRELFCVCLLRLRIDAPFHTIGDRILQVLSLGNVYGVFLTCFYTPFSPSRQVLYWEEGGDCCPRLLSKCVLQNRKKGAIMEYLAT